MNVFTYIFFMAFCIIMIILSAYAIMEIRQWYRDMKGDSKWS